MRWFLTICALLIALPVNGDAAPVLNRSEEGKDFGTITSGPVLHHSFLIRNAGTDPLIITKVLSS
jgi:hypothetical protein